MPTIIENLLKKNNGMVTLRLTPRQMTILHTSLALTRFEIISKANYNQSKPTLEIMDELIKLIYTKLKEKEKK